MRASIPGSGRIERNLALPCVVEANDAKAMADRLLAREWATRERVRVCLPPDYLVCEPGDEVALPDVSGRWRVESVVVERGVVQLECTAVWAITGSPDADPGRPATQADVVALPSRVVVLDLPPTDGSATTPTLQVALASPSNTYRRTPLEVAVNGVVRSAQSAVGEAIIGDVEGMLPDGAVDVVDPALAIEVALVNDQHWLVSADDAALAAGINVAVIGEEIVQFASAVPIAEGRFRLSGFRRGLQGSGAAMAGHRPGEIFVLLQEASLATLRFTAEQVGSIAEVTALGVGNMDQPPTASRTITA